MTENELNNEQTENQQDTPVVTDSSADDVKSEAVEPQNETETNADNNEEVVAANVEATETPAPEAKAEVVEEEVVPAVPASHDEFDWTLGKRAEQNYQEVEYDKLYDMYDGTFKTLNEHEIVTGIVEAITDSDVVLDVGFKSDGLVSTSEFRDLMPDLKKGDEVEVYVLEKEDDRGQLRLSRKNAKLLRAWESIVSAHENDTLVTGTVISKTKGGLIANVFGLETFLPGSQIDVKPIIDYDAYVGVTMEFKVVKINEAIKNAVVSHKALIESDLEDQRQKIIAQLEKGQVLEGTVKNITDFGAFIDLGGVDGLLYITDISWGRINHPSEILENGQKLNVVVIDFDDAKKRISLGLKQLTPHPWDVLDEELKEGSSIKGRIVNIEDYGGFLEITPGVEGLIHVSEVSWSNQPVNAREYFQLGEMYDAKIVTLDREDRKMSLSIKQLQADPWDSIKDTFPISSKHSGEVKNLTPYGVFVELAEGIGGMVHISDLSWTKRFNHPSEYTRVGQQLEVVILGIDQEARKLSLGHKQIEEDPWDTFETVFPRGSEHTGTIIKRDDKGGIVALPYGLEAFAPNKYLKKEDGSNAQLDETLTFRIREFDRNDKRIIVSHADSWKLKKDEQYEQERQQKQTERKQTSERVRKTNKQSDKTTLGDLSVLSQLKKQMEEDEK
ncbi:MAG: 30S ribosomal protein S1 [Chitinophagales bacterium]